MKALLEKKNKAIDRSRLEEALRIKVRQGTTLLTGTAVITNGKNIWLISISIMITILKVTIEQWHCDDNCIYISLG